MRFLLATEFLFEQLATGGVGLLAAYPMADLAVSAVTFEWILADVELDGTLPAAERAKWRTNVTNFRKTLIQAGGRVPPVSEAAIRIWGKAMLLDLSHGDGAEGYEMPVEERFVIATAAELGLIYLTRRRDWNAELGSDFGLAVQEV